MYVNEKLWPVETIPGMGEKGIKRVMEWVNSSKIYLMYYKNFCKCYNVAQCNSKKKNQSLAKQVFYSLNKIIFLQKIKKN
jgi:hypothetical protein